MRKIKTIDIQAKEWRDRINGNSYFAGTVTINYGLRSEKAFVVPFQYGYGESYLQEAAELLRDKGYHVPAGSFTRFCRENDIILRNNIQYDAKKRDLLAIKED